MSTEIEKLQTDLNQKITEYYDELIEFYKVTIKSTTQLATANVTDVRLSSVENELDKLVANATKSPAFGLFILDLAFSFIPIIGGHLLQATSKLFFQDSIMRRRSLLHFATEAAESSLKSDKSKIKVNAAYLKNSNSLKVREAIYSKWKSKADSLYNSAVDKENLIEKLKKQTANITTSNPLFEFATPLANDMFQEVGKKLYDTIKLPELKEFNSNAALSQNNSLQLVGNTYDYTKLIISRHGKQPNALFTFFIDEIISRQINIEKNCKKIALSHVLFFQELNHLKSSIEYYSTLLTTIPKGNDLTYFKLVNGELFEATIWIMYLGNPRKWLITQDTSSGRYLSTPREGGMYNYIPASFTPKVEVSEVIFNHLLDAFHPFSTYNQKSDFKSYREFYRELKARDLPQHFAHGDRVGVDVPKGYKYEVPNAPMAPPESTRSLDFNADITAFENLVRDFSKFYDAMQGSAFNFTNIIATHRLG